MTDARCEGCGNRIDPATCWCGASLEHHASATAGHQFVPMGCTCHKEKSLETGLVFNKNGDVIYWHTPIDRTAAALPDSHSLWELLWEHRGELGGVAHTHPWHGTAAPSNTDVTTFAAIEDSLGRRLIWPVVTFSEVGYFEWVGPDRYHYGVVRTRRFRISREHIEKLRELSR